MKKYFLFFSVLFFVSQINAQQKTYYPTANLWERKSLASVGVDSVKLQQAIDFAIANETKSPKNLWLTQAIQFGKEPYSDPVGPMANRTGAKGIIIHKGYIIASWGEVDQVEMVNSVTKSFLSTVVGLAFQKGLIQSLDDKVYPYVPPIEVYHPTTEIFTNVIDRQSFIYPFASEHNKKITWNHLLRQTSDWEGELWGKPDWADRPSDKFEEWSLNKRYEPGTHYKYNDTRVNALALATTAVLHKPIPEVFRQEIMNPIGASNTWLWTGYKNAWIVLDGQLIQSVSGGGHFGGGIFMNAYDMARFGLLTLRKGNWNGKQLIQESWIKHSTTPTESNNQYGFMNYFLNTNRTLYPSAPATAYAHIGNGTNMIYIDSENDIVAVVRWIENNAIDPFLQKMLAALPSNKK
jgi:CubicO group peptidase (beta-lactamase class C family)